MTPRDPPPRGGGTDLFRSREATDTGAVARLVETIRSGDPVILVDVRPREAYEEAHVRGALHVPAGEEAEHVDALPRDQLVYVYGADATAGHAAEAAFLLGRAGVPAQEVPGGFEALRAQDVPLQTGPDPGAPADG